MIVPDCATPRFRATHNTTDRRAPDVPLGRTQPAQQRYRPLSKYPYPIPSREEILGVLRTADAALSANDIAEALAIKKQEREGFFKRLAAMERDDQIRLDRHGYYQLTHPSNFIAGRVIGHRDGYGFAVRDEGGDDLFLPSEEMKKVMHNDRVLLRVAGYDRRGRPEGHIVEVVSRANTHVIGRLLNENGVMVVAPEDKRIGHDILIPPRAQGKAKVGQVVSVELTDYPSRYSQPIGRVSEVLGDIDDPGMEIEIAVRKYGVPHQFSAEALAAAGALPDEVRAPDLRHRIDLRDVPLVTIDGEDARDFDDAVYCEPAKVGRSDGFRLIVAIADVSHYVTSGGPLDADALTRSTSVYFPRRVIPMLPEKLSNGLCSLNPDVDRCVLVCDALVAPNGEVKAYQFYPAVIHSAARLTYTEVAAVLGNTKGPEAQRRAALLPHLQNLYELYKVLAKARKTRGAIEFDSTETYIVCNAQGKIEQILPRTRNDAHRLIEECMLTANVCAADLLKRHKQAGLYRIHAGPSGERLQVLRTFLKTLGLSLGGGDEPATSDYADLMTQIESRPDAPMLQTMLLRSMQQAVYSPDNIGHFGLAYPAYAHFTSPIRRYPDLLTHRAIKAILAGKKYEPEVPAGVEMTTGLSPHARKLQKADDSAAGKAKKAAGTKKHDAIWDELGLHCSANERRADEASRDVEAWLKCYFMRDKLGEEYGGTVSAVTSFGIFVQLDDLFIEGLVHVTELGSDYFQFDEVRHELRGERTGIRYRLTDRVRVQVSRVDLDARKIDFRLVREVNARTLAKTSGRTERGGAPVPAPAAGAPGLAGSAGSAAARPGIRQMPKGGALLNGVQLAPAGKHAAKPKSVKVNAARAERGATSPAKSGGGKAPVKRPGGPAKKPRR